MPVNGLVPRDLFDTRQNAASCVSTLGSCQSCFEVTFYHLRFGRQLRRAFCQEQAAGVERTTSGMSGLIRSLAPGDRG